MPQYASNNSDISSEPSASDRLCLSTRTREQLSTRSRLRTYFSNSGVRIPLRYPEYSPMPKPRAKASNTKKDFLMLIKYYTQYALCLFVNNSRKSALGVVFAAESDGTHSCPVRGNKHAVVDNIVAHYALTIYSLLICDELFDVVHDADCISRLGSRCCQCE